MKGIRDFVNSTFVALLPTRAEVGNKVFRKNVMQAAVLEFSITVASAATHYNHAFKLQKAADPASVEGLGRPEGKNNGGRKKGSKNGDKTPTGATAVVAGIWNESARVNFDADPTDEAPVAVEAAAVEDAAPSAEQEVELWDVVKKSDGTVVAKGVTEEEGTKLVEAAKKQKKAALILQA